MNKRVFREYDIRGVADRDLDDEMVTDLGRAIASVKMLLGWCIHAVPTGIISAEISQQRRSSRTCAGCLAGDHEQSARFCKICGSKLPGT